MPRPEYGDSRSLARQRTRRRDARLRDLGYESYAAYIQSPAWRDVKRRYRAAGLPHDCAWCGRDHLLLMHHKTYERVGEESLSDLMPLCWHCHARLHDLERDGIVSLDFTGVLDERRAIEGRVFLTEQADRRAAELQQDKADRRAAKEPVLATMTIRERLAQAKLEGALITSGTGRGRYATGLKAFENALRERKPHRVLLCLQRLEAIVYGWDEPHEGSRTRRLRERATEERARKTRAQHGF